MPEAQSTECHNKPLPGEDTDSAKKIAEEKRKAEEEAKEIERKKEAIRKAEEEALRKAEEEEMKRKEEEKKIKEVEDAKRKSEEEAAKKKAEEEAKKKAEEERLKKEKEAEKDGKVTIDQKTLTITDVKICQKEGHFRNPFDCTRFYRCHVDETGKMRVYDYSRYPCSSGMVFDEIEEVCLPASQSAKCNNKHLVA